MGKLARIGKLMRNIGLILLLPLFFKVPAFKISAADPGYLNDRPSISIGDPYTWADVSIWKGTGGMDIVFITLIIFIFAIAENLILRSYFKKKKLWKKILVIIFDIPMILLSLFYFIMLLTAAGDVNLGPIYLFTLSPTGAISVLYLVVLSILVGVTLKTVGNFKEDVNNSPPS